MIWAIVGLILLNLALAVVNVRNARENYALGKRLREQAKRNAINAAVNVRFSEVNATTAKVLDDIVVAIRAGDWPEAQRLLRAANAQAAEAEQATKQ